MSDQTQSTEQTQNVQAKKPWYKKWWVIGIAAIFFYSIISNSFNEARDKAQEAKTATSTNNVQANDAVAQQQKSEESFNFEVIKKVPGGTTLVMQIYTTEKESDRIIKMTDKFLNENKGLTHLNIEYFDDRELAASYFDKQLDEKISKAEKDKMFTHYIASLTYNTVSGYKVLKRNQNNNWVELKKY